VLVYDRSLDDILGVVRVRELFSLVPQPPAPFDLRPLIRPVLTVPETRAADDLLEDMRRAGRHLAVVVDEYGGTAGIVTLTDLLGALVGRIDEEPAPDQPRLATPAADGSLLLGGLLRVGELEELLGTELDPEARAEVATLGGLVMARLDRMPGVGDEVRIAGRRLRIEQLDGRRVALVRLFPPEPEPAPEPGDQPG
jgi:CBS domain containing-hemolysin-like protein